MDQNTYYIVLKMLGLGRGATPLKPDMVHLLSYITQAMYLVQQ